MEGGPSHIDLFDPKPELDKLAGKPLPESFGKSDHRDGNRLGNTLMPSRRKWEQHGQSGLWVSDWFPHIAQACRRPRRDPLLLGRRAESRRLGLPDEHRLDPRRPAVAGRWVTYGLGTANENLPAFVVLTDSKSVVGGAQNWSSGFLPASTRARCCSARAADPAPEAPGPDRRRAAARQARSAAAT